MSEKTYILQRTTTNDVIFEVHPISNIALKKIIRLTSKQPQVALPSDWALGVFFDEGPFSLYKQGYITFNDNESVIKEAIEAGVYFDIDESFVPASTDDVPEILATLKSGNRANILKAIDKYGNEKVRDVAVINITGLTTGVVNMLESIFKVQLTLDGGE